MKNLLKLSFLIIVSITIIQCKSSDKNTSSLTGWKFNDAKYGNLLKGDSKKNGKTPSGMVFVEGGSFTMGEVQDDVMFDWNTTPQKMHVRSFFMDEAEVTNSEYSLFLQYTKKVYPPNEPQYKHIYESILPDTLVWRRTLGNTELLSENYFRNPAYSDYPVVGVSWLQANQYCKWRTNAVNLKTLMDKGVINNIFVKDSLDYKGQNSFDTDVYLNSPYAMFGGDSTVYKKGLPVPRAKGQKKTAKGEFKGRHVSAFDGILSQKFRLPTEAEWEYAAKSNVGNREYNNLRGRKKYAWNGKYTRDKSRAHKGNHLSNFKQSKGNYSGVAGWSTDAADIPTKVKSFPPNAFGLYDMSGNVSEWVSDVYRPLIDSDANDFNYYRGNVFTKRMIDENGKVVIIDNNNIEYDTLQNGNIIPKALPGTIKYVPITKDEAYMRTNYSRANNINFNDGDKQSSTAYIDDDKDNGTEVYNAPRTPKYERDSITGKLIRKYDSKRRTTLIDDRARVYKGGSWRDREYWLDPSHRRFLPEYVSTNYIGFRCVVDNPGAMVKKKRTPRHKTK